LEYVEECNEKYPNHPEEVAVYVGWRDHRINSSIHQYGLRLTFKSADELLEKIKKYQVDNNLENRPYLVTENYSWSKLTDYKLKHLVLFCFPDQNPKIEWVGDLYTLKNVLDDTSKIRNNRSVRWRANSAFIEHQRDRIADQIKDLEHKRSCLDEIEQPFIKRRKIELDASQDETFLDN
jgi:hypothetical protein